MTIREQMEELELTLLSPRATFDVNSRGRMRDEAQCDIRPVFQRDRDRVLHSKAFRRLKNKTQVFLTPLGDHYRTRMSHTLEVSQNARTIAKALRLNEDLVEAIGLGHDLGHTPFGHAGERVLNDRYRKFGGFSHNEQSCRVAMRLEKDGAGMNLTWEVLDGILNHETRLMPSTPEGRIVRISDKIAYTYHDIDDAIRARILSENDIPGELRHTLGMTAKARLNTMIHNVITTSRDTGEIGMSDEIWQALQDLRAFMFRSLYTNPVAKSEEVKAQRMLRMLCEYYEENYEEIPEKFRRIAAEDQEAEIKLLRGEMCDTGSTWREPSENRSGYQTPSGGGKKMPGITSADPTAVRSIHRGAPAATDELLQMTENERGKRNTPVRSATTSRV